MSNSSNIVSLNITKFPQNLLIPDIDNDVSIQITNNSDKKQNFSFAFEGENIELIYKSGELKDGIELAPKETKNIEISLNPTANGFGKLTINGYMLKIIEYTVKEQKVKETVPKNKLNKILEDYKFKGTEKINPLEPKEFIREMTPKEIQKVEEQLETMKNNYNLSLSSNTTSTKAFTRVTIEVIDKTIKQLAKGYLSNNNIDNALNLALKLSVPTERFNFYTDIVRVYAFDNINEAVQIIHSLDDPNLQQNLIKSLIFDQASQNSMQVWNLTENITNISIKISFLFNIAKQLKLNNKNSKFLTVLKKIVEIVLKSGELNSEDKKDQKVIYEALKDAIYGIAEIENPIAANKIIEEIDKISLKDRISKDLFDDIYELVEEIRTKLDSELIFSQYFLFNTLVSNITKEIKNFSNIGGNVSNNILSNNYNFQIVFLSLFGFDFSIFPFIDRVYNDLKFNSNKAMGYYIFPSVNNYQNNEFIVLQKTLSQFFNNFTNIPNQLLVFNLDFIPYLGKPTIILSSDSQLNITIKSKIEKLGNTVNLIVDDSMFKGGEIYDNLKKIIPPDKGEIFNLILSYEFINDYETLLTFVQSLF